MPAALQAQQQEQQPELAEVEEAARQAGRGVLAQAACMGKDRLLADLLRQPSSGIQAERAAAFLAAAEHSYLRCMQALLAAAPPGSGAELAGARDEVTGRTALGLAAARGHAGCVALALQAHDPGAQVTVPHAPHAHNALMLAAAGGHVRCMARLLQHSPEAQVSAVGSDGHSALTLVASAGRLDAMKLLLRHAPHTQHLDEALMHAADGWAVQQQQQQQQQQRDDSGGSSGAGAAAAAPARPYTRCIELLLAKGARLGPGVSAAHAEAVWPIVQDLVARALVPGMANEAIVRLALAVRGPWAGAGAGSAAARGGAVVRPSAAAAPPGGPAPGSPAGGGGGAAKPHAGRRRRGGRRHAAAGQGPSGPDVAAPGPSVEESLPEELDDAVGALKAALPKTLRRRQQRERQQAKAEAAAATTAAVARDEREPSMLGCIPTPATAATTAAAAATPQQQQAAAADASTEGAGAARTGCGQPAQ